MKLIVVYHGPPVNTAKIVYVARDAGISKGAGLDPTQISADLFVRYGNNAAAGAFNVPAGIYNGTSGWLANKPTVAKFVNRDAPTGGDTDAKVVVVKPGKHTISSRVGGVGIFKKETEVEIEAEAGGEYYVACNIKQSFTRARLEMIEVTKGTGKKQMEKMTLDNCQEKIDEKQGK